MKFKSGLILALLLFLPGWYAIIAWTLSNINDPSSNMAELEIKMRRLVPIFQLSIKQTILFLIALNIGGLAIGLNMPAAENKSQKRWRVGVLIAGLFSTAALCFALM